MSASDGSKNGNLSQRQRAEIANTMFKIIRAIIMVRKENFNTRRVVMDLLAGHNAEAWEKFEQVLDKERQADDNLGDALEALKRLTEVLFEGEDG